MRSEERSPTAGVREHLWWRSRERTAVTALLLLVVIGTAHAARGGAWPQVCVPSSELQVVDVRATCSARPNRPAAVTPPPSPWAAGTPVCAARSIADAELPPVRAPDPS